MEVLAFISFFLGASWDFFTETKVPGFEFSFAALFIGIFLANLGLRFLFSMLGMSIDSQTVLDVSQRVKTKEKHTIGFRGD